MQSTRIRTTLLRCAPAILSLFIAACGGGSNPGSAIATSKDEETPAEAKAEVAAAASAAATEDVPTAISMKVHAAAIKNDAQTDRFIVKYKDETAERKDTNAVERKLNRLATAFPAKAHHKRRMGIGADVITSDRKLNATEAKAFMRAIASDPDVEYVEPDVEMTVTAIPNDPDYSTQWHLHSNLNPATANEPGIRAEGAWDIAKGAGSVIAIVDNGVTSHSDLNANLLAGQDFGGFVTGNGYGMNLGFADGTCQVTWHGTHVAGIAAALTNNGVGVAGVAPDAKVVSIRVLSACGIGPMSSVADGITWAAGGTIPGAPVNSHPAKVINLSLASNNMCQQTLQSAIDDATGRGAIVVAAAGNDNRDAYAYQPASCRNVLTVGGSANGGRWGSSNYGTVVDLAAPAFYIWSTLDKGTTLPSGETYGYMSGTSMAAPMVSGVIALAQSVAPTPLSVAEYRALLQQTVQPFTAKVDQPVGPGLLDAANAVKQAKSGSMPVAADFTCAQVPNTYWVDCVDRSTARGSAQIKSWAWNDGVAGSADKVLANSGTRRLMYEYGGAHTIKLTITDTNGKQSSYARPIALADPPSTSIEAGIPATVNANKGDGADFNLQIPVGAKSITATLSTVNNQVASLYLKNSPTTINPDCESIWHSGTFSCTVNNPPPGKYYIIALATTSGPLNNATLTWTYTK